MNHIYRVVYNAATNTYQAVPENSTGKHKTASEKSSCAVSDVSEKGAFFSLKPIALCAMAMGLSSTGAWAAPTGGHISAGDASIAQHGKITNIQQNSQKAAINWQTFGIKADETVNFKQPNAQAVILNRVIGNEKSVIDGAMNANGKVFISNPNGMIIGKNAQINVGALLATTAKIKDQDFMNGLFKFDQATGDITHLGDIKVPTGGVVALIAPIVANKGNITAPQGKVLLASAEQFSITLPDNGQFAYTLDRGTLQGLVDNGGAILADGGHVILTAKGTDAVKKSLIKHTGKIEANTVQNKNGVIELLGDLDNTRLEASGSLKAEAKEKGDGGFIETSAVKVSIRDLSVSTKSKFGKTGEWLIDPQDFNINAGSGEHTETSIGADTLSQNLQATDITISTDSNGSEKGDIYVNAPVSWDNNRLTLSAHNNIYINENLNGSGNARLELKYGQASENAIQADGTESDYYIQKGKKIDLPTGQNLVVQRGSSSDNARRLTVLHSLPNDGRLFPKYVALGTDLNLSGQPFTQGLNGVELFHGLGHEIDGLEIDHTQNMSGQSPEHIGFIPNLSGGIRDLTLNNVNIKAQINDDCDGNCNEPIGVGALIGRAGDATIKNVYVSGKMSDLGNYGNVKMGGLIGIADGRVRVINSHTDVNIEKQEQTQANELVGLDNGGLSVENSQGTGNITNIEPTQPVNPPVPTTPPTPTQPVIPPAQPTPTTPPVPTTPNPTTSQDTSKPDSNKPVNKPTGQNTSQDKPTSTQDTPKPSTNNGNQQPVNNTNTGTNNKPQNQFDTPTLNSPSDQPNFNKIVPDNEKPNNIKPKKDEILSNNITSSKIFLPPGLSKAMGALLLNKMNELESSLLKNDVIAVGKILKEIISIIPDKDLDKFLRTYNPKNYTSLLQLNNHIYVEKIGIDSAKISKSFGKIFTAIDVYEKAKLTVNLLDDLIDKRRDGTSVEAQVELTLLAGSTTLKAPIAIVKSAASIADFAMKLSSGKNMEQVLAEQANHVSSYLNSHLTYMNTLSKQLASGQITIRDAKKRYEYLENQSMIYLNSFYDNLTPSKYKTGAWGKISGFFEDTTLAAAIVFSGNAPNVYELLKKVDQARGTIKAHSFDDILKLAQARRYSNGNFTQIR